MKKLIFILTVLLISYSTKAQSISFTNNTCSVIRVTLFCSDQTYTNCATIESDLILVGSGGSTTTLTSPASINPYYQPPSNTSISYYLNGASTFDAIKVGANDNQGCTEYFALGNCGLPQTFTGSCHFCGGNLLQVTWTVSGSNTSVTFDN